MRVEFALWIEKKREEEVEEKPESFYIEMLRREGESQHGDFDSYITSRQRRALQSLNTA